MNGYQLDEKGEKMRDSEGRYIRTAGEDGVLDEADMVVLANSTPIPFSINNTFRWKNWDANIYIYGSLNGWKVNDIKLQSIYGIEDITYGVNVLDEVKNRWSPANPMGTLPGVAEASSGVDPKKSDFSSKRLGICVWIMCQSVILSLPNGLRIRFVQSGCMPRGAIWPYLLLIREWILKLEMVSELIRISLHLLLVWM